ncbi:MAG: hypothetical protein Q7S40_08195 [Opitutaceae bacterium]|nr:hypothetical protein [Opitutaceae bacterium]
MIGWVADLFRLAWGLLYWNARKTWFRLRRGQSPCPCQSLSDSGRPFETQCEACLSWNRRARFKRVCPLLVDTTEGLRCSVATADVRPFWGITARYYGAAALTVYVLVVVSVFAFLRTVGYPVSIVHVAVPPLWHRVGEARGWYFLDRSNRAFAAGKTTEGLLYLDNAYQFDPSNYSAGLRLAKYYQAGQPGLSDDVYKELLRDHPDKTAATAQDWLRALLARGDNEKITRLARERLLAGGPHANAWMRALLFATRQTRADTPLRELLTDRRPAAAAWHRLLETELLLRAGRKTEARAALEATWAGAPPYALFYRVDRLIALREPAAALDVLVRHPNVLDGDAEATLRLEAYFQAGANNLWQAMMDALLAPRLDPPRLVIICAHLIRHPNAAVFDRICTKLEREPLALNTETAGIWFSLLCTAGAVGDRVRLHEFTQKLKTASSTPFVVLGMVEAFFRGETVERRVTTFLPILPLPLEVTYALLERYGSAPVVVTKNA